MRERSLTAGADLPRVARHKGRVATGNGHARKYWGGLGTQVLVEAGARFVPFGYALSYL